MEIYYYWLIAAIVLVIAEIATAGFGVICFAIGALGAAVASYFDLSFTWQLGIFAIVSMLAFIFVRPFVLRLLDKRTKEFKTNADALIGRKAVVSETIDAAAHTGRVAVDGDDWKAVSEDGGVIEKGSEVTIVGRDSLIVTVK